MPIFERISTEVEAFEFNPEVKLSDLPKWFQDAVSRKQVTYFNTRVLNINTIGTIYIVHEGDYVVLNEQGNIISYKKQMFNRLFKIKND
jgi:hypothetical protein